MTVVGTLLVELGPGVTTYRIEVDGIAKGEGHAGQEIRLALTPGSHAVRVKHGLVASPELRVHLGPAATTRVRVEKSGLRLRIVQLE